MDLRSAIQSGDVAALRHLLAVAPERANQMIVWGKNGEILTHPLHFVSDMLFAGSLSPGQEIPIVDCLLSAGSNFDHQAANGETPLIGAASLRAQSVGLRLLNAGADVTRLGGMGETALHWAAHEGLAELVAELVRRGADLHVKDARYHSTPLYWAIHGRFQYGKNGSEPYLQVVKTLLTAGARVDAAWLSDSQIRSDAQILQALEAAHDQR